MNAKYFEGSSLDWTNTEKDVYDNDRRYSYKGEFL